MKRSINFLFLFLLVGCSSLPTGKKVNTQVSRNAREYLFIADELRLKDKTADALNTYDKAASLYISKLQYNEYVLTLLKKSDLLIKKKRFDETQNNLDLVSFCIDEFDLNLKYEVLGIKTKLLFAKGERDKGERNLDELISYFKENSKEEYGYYLAQKIFYKEKSELNELETLFKEQFSSYERGKVENVETLIYIGQVLLQKESQKSSLIYNQLEEIARELEIKSLSSYLLGFRKKGKSKKDTFYYDQILKYLN